MLADWQLVALLLLGGALGIAIVNVSMKMDKVEAHLRQIVHLLEQKNLEGFEPRRIDDRGGRV